MRYYSMLFERNTMKKNKGYITVEASLVIPIFLFFMLAMSGIYMILMAEAHIHQSLSAAVDRVAELYYLKPKVEENGKGSSQIESANRQDSLMESVAIKQQFNVYVGKDFYIEKYITGGKDGIFIHIEEDRSNPKIIIATAKYQACLNLPLLGTYSINLSNQIKQKTFVGFTEEEYTNQDYYVFVTPNREAYHMRRDCTHLMLDVNVMRNNRKTNYAPCFYCGTSKSDSAIYIAKSGEVYHNNRDCVGLKRTVRRVKLSTVKGVRACQRCGR